MNDESPHTIRGGVYRTRGKETLEGFNHNSNLMLQHNTNKRKTRKEETWKGGETQNKRVRNR